MYGPADAVSGWLRTPAHHKSPRIFRGGLATLPGVSCLVTGLSRRGHLLSGRDLTELRNPLAS